MATYTEDFSSHADGSAPANFTHLPWATGADHFVVAAPDYSGGKCLLYSFNTFATGRRGIVWTTPGSITGFFDFRCRVRIEGQLNNDIRLLGRADINSVAGAETSAFLELLTDAGAKQRVIRYYSAGTLTNLSSIQAYHWEPNTWINLRFMGDETDTFMAKTWLEGETEPGTWTINGLNTAAPDAGYVGIGSFGYHAMEIDAFTLGTAGNNAPELPALPTPPTYLPDPPTSVNVRSYGNGVKLTWTAVTGANGYKIYRGPQLVGSTTSTEYLDTTLLAEGSYDYRILAYKVMT